MKLDKVNELPLSLRSYLPRFIDNRLNEIKHLQKAIELCDKIEILKWTHKVIGICANYNLYQLEAMAQDVEDHVNNNRTDELELKFSNITKYLEELSKSLSS